LRDRAGAHNKGQGQICIGGDKARAERAIIVGLCAAPGRISEGRAAAGAGPEHFPAFRRRRHPGPVADRLRVWRIVRNRRGRRQCSIGPGRWNWPAYAVMPEISCRRHIAFNGVEVEVSD
jgi:hypothetical protein